MLKVNVRAEQGIFLVLKRHADLPGKGVGMKPDTSLARHLAYPSGLHPVALGQFHSLIRRGCIDGSTEGTMVKGVRKTLMRPSALPCNVSITASLPSIISSKLTSRRSG